MKLVRFFSQIIATEGQRSNAEILARILFECSTVKTWCGVVSGGRRLRTDGCVGKVV